ncbi:MAG: D-alanyl-D-alanine carboxypeptidase, partial [bacterium]
MMHFHFRPTRSTLFSMIAPVLVLVLAAGALHAQTGYYDDLSSAIETILRENDLKGGTAGIYVEAVKPPVVVFSKNADVPLKPASNNKLLATC